MSAPPDYPFSNWTDYFNAVAEVCSTEFFGSTYPAYENILNSQDGSADIEIVQSILDSGASPQEGLDGLLKTCIVNSRYSCDFMDVYDCNGESAFASMLKALFDRGARLNLDILLAHYIAEGPHHFEDEAYTTDPRGQLIWMLQSFVPDIISQLDAAINWSALVPIYWENIRRRPTTMDELRTAIYRATKHRYEAVTTRYG